MFRSRLTKHAYLLLRHAEKVRRYRSDVMGEETRADFDREIAGLRHALKSRDPQAVQASSEKVDALIGSQSAPPWEAGWRENTEVILVAVIVAVAVRSYFIQPFKIPTGSMQPTLNGIIGYPSQASAPNVLQQVAEFFLLGRNYINVVARDNLQVEEVASQKYFFFFNWSRIICDTGNYLVYCPPEILRQDFHVQTGNRYQRGQVIARGAVDTGDQVLVDKFSYNFVKPSPGDVFVFRTNHIIAIPADPQSGPPFFIKRLAGVGGNTLRVEPPLLYIDGHPAQRYGFQRVMSARAPYRGYSSAGTYLSSPDRSFTVPEHTYFAMGDNSYYSYDSRYWGPVPEENLIGRGLAVYWPFNRHWGFIR